MLKNIYVYYLKNNLFFFWVTPYVMANSCGKPTTNITTQLKIIVMFWNTVYIYIRAYQVRGIRSSLTPFLCVRCVYEIFYIYLPCSTWNADHLANNDANLSYFELSCEHFSHRITGYDGGLWWTYQHMYGTCPPPLFG